MKDLWKKMQILNYLTTSLVQIKMGANIFQNKVTLLTIPFQGKLEPELSKCGCMFAANHVICNSQ